jgi:pullulanase/glycogen debranching enzyme
MAWGTNPDLLAYTKRLIALRRGTPALSHGKMRVWQADADTIAFSRRDGAQEVLVALNNGDKPRQLSLPVPPDSRLKAGATLTDALNGGSTTVVNRQVMVSLEPKQARVFVTSIVNAQTPSGVRK